MKPAAHPFAEQFDKVFRGRTGAETKLHAVTHKLERAGRRLPFQLVHIHVQTMPPKNR
jgi:hypothetical protein